MSSKLLKSIKSAISMTITIVFNQMINTGIFPDVLKIANL